MELWSSYKSTNVRLSVPLLPALFGIGSLVFSDFWHNHAIWQYPKCNRDRLSKKTFWRPKFGDQKPPNKRVFWTFKLDSLVFFSDFWQKYIMQDTLKWDRNNFSWNFFFRRKLRIFVFVEFCSTILLPARNYRIRDLKRYVINYTHY